MGTPGGQNIGQRAPRRGKPHCEAFPAIDILEVERGLRDEATLCEWRDERGSVVGHGTLLEYDAREMRLKYSFVGTANIARCTGIFRAEVSGSRRNPLNVRNSLHCPRCSRPAQKLFLVSEEWACRMCHSLVFLSQRLGPVNKRLVDRDRMLEELASLPAKKRTTRQFYNQLRHVARLSRDLAAEGFTALPQELLYRTTANWRVGDAVVPETTSDGQTPADPGLVYFQLEQEWAGPIGACELIGSTIMYRPVERYFGQHKAVQFTNLLRDLGLKRRPSLLAREKELAAWLSERLALRALVLTSDWSQTQETVNADGRRECAISARYSGEPTLWPVGPGSRQLKDPLRAILDDEVITLKVRLPLSGASRPRAVLDHAAAKLEDNLSRMAAVIEAFNATRYAAALRRVRYDSVHKPKGVTISRRAIGRTST